jgi:hypothetical protein
MMVHINSKRFVMKNTATFEKDVKAIIDNERIGETGTHDKNVNLHFTTDEYNYCFYHILRNVLSYDVTRIINTNGTIYNGRFEKYPMFNDFIVEYARVRMSNGVFVFDWFETFSFKQNSCKLCCDLDQDIRTFRCYKRHQKNKGHLKNVAFSKKFYADTIADATNLNDDVSMLITSYLF